MEASSTQTRNVFELGKYSTKLQQVGDCNPNPARAPPPKPVLIACPCEAGEFPVLIFLHGYLLYNSFYSQLMQHVASHGFIVIAPQLDCRSHDIIHLCKQTVIAGADATDELKSTTDIINWLSEGLQYSLPPYVRPNLAKLALAGHSRGGKVAFAHTLSNLSTELKISALIGVDPVDGMDKGKQTPPHVLTYVPNTLDLDDVAVMVIGSSLGEVKKNPLFPPCAPKGVNHEDFFNECRKPACYFVAEGYGHLDMLDDDTKGIRGKSTYCLCKNGKAREPMRRFTGGIVVAFMRGYLEGDLSELMGIKCGHVVLPVELKTVEFL